LKAPGFPKALTPIRIKENVRRSRTVKIIIPIIMISSVIPNASRVSDILLDCIY
jgi:hypothetical protein